MIDQIFVVLLAVIAGYVALGQIKKKPNVWQFICLYWIALTVKNIVGVMHL